MSNIGKKIKQLRNEKIMTQAELAGDKITRNMLSLIEKGKAMPSIQTLEYIASKLNVSIAFLLADESEEKMFVKYSTISNVRLAFKSKNYHLCLDMCRQLEQDMTFEDDEVNLIIAESAVAIAEEKIYCDKIRDACILLDKALLYSKKTLYNTKHVKSIAMIVLEYLGQLSPSLVSENMDWEDFNFDCAKAFGYDDILCRYIIALDDLNNDYYIDNEAYDRHIECKKYINDGDFEKAYNILKDILKLNLVLPGILLYGVFSDLEECCKKLGNSQNAKIYSDEKISQLERLLS